MMDEIASRIPERLWLNRMSAKGGVLSLKGLSLDAEIVAAFMTGLEESPLLSKVELLETRLEEIEGLKLNTFEIKGRYPHVQPAEATQKPPPYGRRVGG